ncbi:MAG: DUF1508 domain-containing protein [Candidatus Contendobacter sp.]|nr:DUF1508 domain-containing protein [Candidatus Contendobacter sp.]
MYFEIYQERQSGLASLLPPEPTAQWRWRLRGGNNEIIASGESYYNKQDCLHTVQLVMNTNKATPVREL